MSAHPTAAPSARSDWEAFRPAAISPGRRLWWSVRRELWENRWVYVAPLIVAGGLVLAFAAAAVTYLIRGGPAPSPARPVALSAIELPYGMAARALVLTTYIVAFFYCAEALHGERRDRSILFWKSLPVSDTLTVLSKATIPLVVLPGLTVLLVIATHLLILPIGTAFLRLKGSAPTFIPPTPPFGRIWATLIASVLGLALWDAPVYAWLLLVSAWARRAPIVWAVVPVIAVGIMSQIAFNAWPFGPVLVYHLEGLVTLDSAARALSSPRASLPVPLTAGAFLAMPRLGLGLLLAAAFLAAAVRLRRYREPI